MEGGGGNGGIGEGIRERGSESEEGKDWRGDKGEGWEDRRDWRGNKGERGEIIGRGGGA